MTKYDTLLTNPSVMWCHRDECMLTAHCLEWKSYCLLSIKFSMIIPHSSVTGLPHSVFFPFKSPTITVLGVKSEEIRFRPISMS